MPLNTVQSHLKSILDQLPLPGDLGILKAFVTPPNPETDARDPAAYIWGSHGDEIRLTVPRAQPGNLASGGDKTLTHQVDIWLVWFGESAAPNSDTQWPAVVDAVMATLRNTKLLDEVTEYAVDPVTGQLSQLINIGENMTWDQAPVRAIADQRYFRYDAQITCEVIEIIQA